MQRIHFGSLISAAVAVGFSSLSLVACSDAATAPFAQPAQGGDIGIANVGGAVATGQGGSSQTSSQTGQGGSSQTSSQTGQGGNSQTSSQTGQGGNSIATGGNRSTTNTGGGNATGGTRAMGGSTSNTGGNRATGGSIPGVGGSQSTGGTSAAIGGNSPTGGSSSSNSCSTPEEEKFSFFLTSKKVLQELSGSNDGHGGDLGGITGADAICQKIAEKSAPCHRGSVTWHAFLSTPTENAKDRIGKGPWYDRRGRLLSANLTNLIQERPSDADASIKNDFPNEDGVPNHAPEGTQLDNHQILTGSGTDGNVYTQTGVGMSGTATSCGPANSAWSKEAATCWGWTSKEEKGCPRVGHSWPRDMSGRHWISVWNEGGCAPGGVDNENITPGLDGTPRVGSAGGYGGFYCFAVTGN